MITKNDIVKLIKKKIPGYTVTENASLREVFYDLLTYVEGNTANVVVGPESVITGNVALFDGTTGKSIKDSEFLGSDVMLKNMFTATNQFVTSTSAGVVGVIAGAGLFGKMKITTIPATYDAAGTIDYLAFDGEYLYICTVTGAAGAGRWSRVAFSTSW